METFFKGFEYKFGEAGEGVDVENLLKNLMSID